MSAADRLWVARAAALILEQQDAALLYGTLPRSCAPLRRGGAEQGGDWVERLARQATDTIFVELLAATGFAVPHSRSGYRQEDALNALVRNGWVGSSQQAENLFVALDVHIRRQGPDRDGLVGYDEALAFAKTGIFRGVGAAAAEAAFHLSPAARILMAGDELARWDCQELTEVLDFELPDQPCGAGAGAWS